jgi:hypothetical protein
MTWDNYIDTGTYAVYRASPELLTAEGYKIQVYLRYGVYRVTANVEGKWDNDPVLAGPFDNLVAAQTAAMLLAGVRT